MGLTGTLRDNDYMAVGECMEFSSYSLKLDHVLVFKNYCMKIIDSTGRLWSSENYQHLYVT